MADVYNISVARLVASGTLDGQLITNVTYWERASDAVLWDNASLQGLAEAYGAWLEDSLAAVVSQNMIWQRVEVTQMKADGALQYSLLFPTPIAGDLTADPLPNNVAACATISTGLSGRSYRGRFYLAGLTEEQTSGSRMASGTVTAINASVNDLVTAEPFSAYILGVYSKVSGGVKRSAGVFTPATSVLLRDNVLDSQRRRLPGRGA